MSSVFLLGPSLANVIEPEPVPATPGRVGIEFQATPTTPGGHVHIKLLDAAEGDVFPVNVYAFYINPPSDVPAFAERTHEWFFKSAAPTGVAMIHSPSSGEAYTIDVAGVLPGAYFLQTVLEFQG